MADASKTRQQVYRERKLKEGFRHYTVLVPTSCDTVLLNTLARHLRENPDDRFIAVVRKSNGTMKHLR